MEASMVLYLAAENLSRPKHLLNSQTKQAKAEAEQQRLSKAMKKCSEAEVKS
jgi:hypothetical protein